MSRMHFSGSARVAGVCAALCVFVAASECRGSAFVRGAHYRLGDDDPGAAHWVLGNPQTRDSLGDY